MNTYQEVENVELPGIVEPASVSLFAILESKWINDVFMPFFKRRRRDITEFEATCRNPLLLHYLMDKSSGLQLSWGDFSLNKGLTIEILTKYIDQNWRWGDVSCNPSISAQGIVNLVNHPDYYWHWLYVCSNPNLTMDIITAHPEMKWS